MRTSRRQRGAALILFATVLILGIAWFTVGLLGQVPVSSAERDVITGTALHDAKRAVLAYVAQYAARFDTAEPGQMPCPESTSLANPGESSTSCSASAIVVGRLPWKTLGIEPLYDGDGEPLWYMMRGFRDPPINLGTAGQLTYNGGAVVALIIAPGKPLNTMAQAGMPPSGCSKVSQLVGNRNTASLVAANFMECGTTTGSIASPGDSTWTNDRVIAITETEWANAIAPAVADRLQRQVAPAMNHFRTTTSQANWGQPFLPNASTFTSASPAVNNLCGNIGVYEGMPPTATVASGLCSTDWTSGTASGLGSVLSLDWCIALATELRCRFTVLLSVASAPRITATAPRIAYSFRNIDPSQITYQVDFGAPQPASTTNHSGSVSSSGNGSFSFDIPLPALSVLSTVRVRIPHPKDALLADTRSEWYVTNGWDRYTYYGVSQAATASPGTSVCDSGGDISGCLTVNDMASPSNDKRLVLALMGRPLEGQSQPSTSRADYLETDNATANDRTYAASRVTNAFNDRLAACPFSYLPDSGAEIVICD